MERRRGGKFMQRAAGEPAAEHGVDRGGNPHHTLLANEAGREVDGPKDSDQFEPIPGGEKPS